MRRDPLVVGQVYHIFTKSIAGFKVFNSDADYARIINVIQYYLEDSRKLKFSQFIESTKDKKCIVNNNSSYSAGKFVEIIAYCIMPSHIHLIMKQIKEKGISSYMRKILDSYTRYFNVKYNRKGPLWEGRFKNVLVKTDEQLLHLTRYIHLNPVSGHLVDTPEDWPVSSYHEYISIDKKKNAFCNYREILAIDPILYKKFTEDRSSYQRKLAEIKNLLIDPFPLRKW